MGPRNIEKASDGSMILRLENVSVKDGKLVCEMVMVGDNQVKSGVRVSEPIEKALIPLVECGQQPKQLLIIVCEDMETLVKYSRGYSYPLDSTVQLIRSIPQTHLH